MVDFVVSSKLHAGSEDKAILLACSCRSALGSAVLIRRNWAKPPSNQ
jgi:hypothetical protein